MNDFSFTALSGTEHLPFSDAAKKAAEYALEHQCEGVRFICLNMHRKHPQDPSIVENKVLNLNIVVGIRPQDKRLVSVVPTYRNIFVMA